MVVRWLLSNRLRNGVVAIALIVGAGVGCESDDIVITPAVQVMGQVLDPQGNAIPSQSLSLYVITKGSLGDIYDTETTDKNGMFTLDFIRHTTVGSDYVVYVPSAYDFPLVGFATHQQIVVDLTSTALYEMLTSAANNCAVSSFTVPQLDAFIGEARTFVASQIQRNLLQLDVSIDLLHKAYDNAVSSDPNLLSMIQAATQLNGTYFNPIVPFPPHNGNPFDVDPSIVGATPKTHSATVNENQTLPLSVSAADYASPPDYIFYAWSMQLVKGADPVNCDNFNDTADGEIETTEVNDGPETVLNNTSYNFNYTPPYDTASWNEPSVAYKVIARASDGGKLSKWIWCTTVVHVERAPVFTTTAVATALEDSLYTYTPAATSPDGAPLYLKLGNYPGSPATTGAGVMDMCINSNYANLHECGTTAWNPATQGCNAVPSEGISAVPAIWKWQNAGTPCTVPNQIVWTPTNCESNIPDAVQVVATDAIGTQGFQTFNITVTEVNQPPVITSSAPIPNGQTIPQAAEWVPWSYQMTSSDVQADPAAFPPNITGDDPNPYVYKPGGVECPDTLTYSFILNPPSATINTHTGLINWTPQDTETGLQPFIIEVADGHGGSAQQSFTVQTAPMELPPYYVSAPTGNTPINITIDEDLYPAGTPYTYSIVVGDPNNVDNNHNHLNVTATGVPAPALAEGPSITGYDQALNSTDWHMTWPIDDTQVPVGGTTQTISLTLCDTNPLNLPFGVYVGPSEYQVPEPPPGPPYNHYCTSQSVVYTLPKRNFQPQFYSNPPSVAVGNSTYTYNVQVTDGNISPADTFTYSLLTTASSPNAAPVNPPAGMTLVSTGNTAPTGTATLTWTPNNTTNLGSHVVEIQVMDNNAYPGGSHYNTQLFSIFVQEENFSPTVTSTCPTTATDGTPMPYTFHGSNGTTTSPNDRMTYSVVQPSPSGMTINSSTGVVSWTPSVAQAQVATQTFTLGVTSGGTTPVFPTVTQTCTVNMTYTPLPPVFTPMSNVTVPINAPMSVTVIATDPAGYPITMGDNGLPTGASYVDNGNGTGTFTWTPTTVGSSTIVFTAQNTFPVSQHLSATPLSWKITVADSPIWQSTPVTSANPNGTYDYEVHVLDPVGLGLTYAVDTGPAGMAFSKNATTGYYNVTWKPGSNDVGNNNVTLRATDHNGNYQAQSFTISVTNGPDSGPSVNSTTPPYASTAVISEGALTNFVVSASEPEGYPLHYDWYLDNAWVYDGSATYAFLPTGTQAGNHTLAVWVTDGAEEANFSFNVHIRDTIPMAGTIYTVPGGNLEQFGLLPVAQEIVTLQGPSSAVYSIFPETGFGSGALATVNGFSFNPARMTVENDFAQNNYLLAFFSSSNQINGSGVSYAEIASDTLQISSCTAAVCFNKTFSDGYPFFGGTDTPYKTSTQTRFDINPANRVMLSSATNGASNADASLGGVTGTAVIYDTVNNLVWVSSETSNEVLALSPTTRAIVGTVDMPGGAGPTLMYVNSVTKLLYVYNTAAGSLSEVNASTFSINTTSSGLPTATSVGNDPPLLMVGNDADNLLYIANPTNGDFITFDINAGNYKSLQGLGAGGIGIDQVSDVVVGASYTNGTLIQLQ